MSFADQAGNISYANERFCQNSGYSFAELQGQNHRMLKSGVHPPEFYQGIWSAIAQGQVWHGESCSRRKDGSLYWVESTITPFVDREGRVYQFVSIQTDISHIKAAEAALRAQRDMQRVISLSAAALMAVPLGRTHEAIDQALQATGLQLGADRAHLYTVAHDGQRFSGEHVWCAPGISPMPEGLQDVALEHMPWLHDHLSPDLVLCLPDVQQLPPADAAPQALLQRCGVRSLLVFALQQEGRPIGFLAYSLQHAPRRWSDEDIALLKVLRDVIGSALVRTWADAALRRSEARLHFLVASSPVTIFTAEARPPGRCATSAPTCSGSWAMRPRLSRRTRACSDGWCTRTTANAWRANARACWCRAMR